MLAIHPQRHHGPMTPDEVGSLLESWITHLQAERKSPHTIRTYTTGVRMYLRWCEKNTGGTSIKFDRASVAAFTASLLADGAEPGTALARQRGVRRFSAWLAGEGEIGRDELAGWKPPEEDAEMPAGLTARPGTASPPTGGKTPNQFHHIRDHAPMRVMPESLVRPDQPLATRVD